MASVSRLLISAELIYAEHVNARANWPVGFHPAKAFMVWCESEIERKREWIGNRPLRAAKEFLHYLVMFYTNYFPGGTIWNKRVGDAAATYNARIRFERTRGSRHFRPMISLSRFYSILRTYLEMFTLLCERHECPISEPI